MALLSEEEGRRVEEAIVRLERRSATEFVVAVVPRSATYQGVRALVAAFWAMAAATAYLELFPDKPALWAIVLQVPMVFLAWTIAGFSPLFRRLIPLAVAKRAVQARAFQIFAERGVHQTRGATGMLLLLSELEHQVVLLGDRGIHERVGTEGWQKYVDLVIRRIRERRAAEGILEVIHELETVLAQGVPVIAGDVNELPNQVLRLD